MTIRDAIRSIGATAAPEAAVALPASPSRRAWRAPLAAKLAAALIGLVVLVLVVNGAINTWLGYEKAKSAALDVQEEKARSAAVRVGEFLADIETQIGWTTGAEWRFAKPDQQRYDFVRLLRQVPAISELSYLDGLGKEQLEVSRLEPDSVGSGKDLSSDPRFARAVADKIWFGPVEFRRGSEPYMTIALAHVGRQPGVTVADVNLKLIWDVISAIHVGEKGYAFVVDGQGRLIAHPDLSLVLRQTDFSQLPQVRQAQEDQAPMETGAMAAPHVSMAEIATGFDGGKVLTAYAVAPRTHWIVFVQLPLAEALASVYSSLIQTLALLGLGLLLALVVGGLLARRMVVPIRRLQQGAERLGAGDLSQRLDIRTGDEIETLADRFNQMAGRIQDSYETLEAKVEARTRDLEESLAQQTATADVLKIISRSAFDLKTVLTTLIESAVGLCGAGSGVVFLRDGETMRIQAHSRVPEAFVDFLLAHPIRPSQETFTGRTLLTGEITHIPDVLEDPGYNFGPAPQIGQFRAALAVPLAREGRLEGVFSLARPEPGAFSAREIELVRTFANQAVIAIENVRLFEEVQAKTRDLEESLAQQTATADVLKVISRSAFDLDAIFQTLVTTAVDLCKASSGTLCVRDGDVFRYRGQAGREATADLQRYLDEHPLTAPSRETIAGRAILSGQVEQIPDVLVDEAYAVPLAAHGNPGRALLAVPLLGKTRVEGAIVMTRPQPGAYSAREIEILQTFADQAMIAIENSRLFEQVQARTRELAASLEDLHKAQDRLIQSEKLASLGQLTAGIAHEIKNPLNFVNNFSALSRELLDELRDLLAKAKLDEAERGEVDDLIDMVASNLEKVVNHGKRADSIVKNMLLHSREGSGERTSVNVNAMVEEALNLAYHGARAEKPSFKVTIAKSLDPAAGTVDLHAQEMTRVLLNLISNGFYATAKRTQAETNEAWEPTITATTRDLGDRVEIAIRDNGTGIPDEVRAKIFNPFFTTKPAGEGTGLGLSLSHDIVVKQHGGALEVSTEPGAFTQFTIVLPRAAGTPEKTRGEA
jgi:signal transduction histidine kinase